MRHATQEASRSDSRDYDEAMADRAKKLSQKVGHRDSWTEKQKAMQMYYDIQVRNHTGVNENPHEHLYRLHRRRDVQLEAQVSVDKLRQERKIIAPECCKK